MVIVVQRAVPTLVGLLLVTSAAALATADDVRGQSNSNAATSSSGAGARIQPLDNYREENITDEEVREIQKVVAEKIPGSILRIGPVTVGCQCSERPGCTNEVVLVVSNAARTIQATFARVKKVWQLSEATRLELRRQQLAEKRRLLSSVPPADQAAYRKELDRETELLKNDMPDCLKSKRPLILTLPDPKPR
jgi:hypothetical protein